MIDLFLSDAVAQIIEGTADNPPGEQPRATFECDSETGVLILYGRLIPAHAIAARHLTVASGDEYLAANFGDRFVGG